MSKTTKRIPGIGGVVLTLIVAGGCDSLVISNPNAPDTPHLLANPASVLTVAQGAMKTWYLTTQGGLGEDQYPALTLAVMSRSHVAMWNNFHIRFYTGCTNAAWDVYTLATFGTCGPQTEGPYYPRVEWQNDPGSPNRTQIEALWYGYYSSLSSARDVLTRIRVANGKLTRSGLFGRPEPLLYVGKTLFRGEKEPEGTTVFFVTDLGDMAVVSNGLDSISYSERSSLAWPLIRIALLSLCLFFMVSSLPYALIWLFLKLVGAMKDVRHLSVRVVPLLATLSLLIVPFCLMRLSGAQIGSCNPWTAGIFLGTSFFPLLSILGLVLVLRVPKEEIHRGVRIHSLLVSSACCVLTGFLLSWHLLALRLWAR